MKQTLNITCLIVFLTLLGVQAQSGDPGSPKLVLKSFVSGKEVRLRWAPSDKYMWDDALKYGYRLTRRTVSVHGQPLEIPRVEILSDSIRPAAGEVWIPQMHNPMTAVVAQAIFGKDFETTGSKEHETFGEIVMESDELTRRFIFALYACDADFTTAEMAGLAYTDTTAVNHETYVYEVSTLQPEREKERGISYVIPTQKTELPRPSSPVAIGIDSTVKVIWNFKELSHVYTSYDIERSSDGEGFEGVNTIPVTSFQMDETGNIIYFDKPSTAGHYWYRIRGRDIFGNKSESSRVFRTEVLPPFVATPEITSYHLASPGQIVIEWQLGQGEGTSVNSWELLKAPSPDTVFSMVVEGISSESRSLNYAQVEEVAYYRMRANDGHNRYRESPTIMVQFPDTIAPPPPKHIMVSNIEGHTIHLAWEPVPEKHLRGYDIYFAPAAHSGFSKLNKAPIIETEYDFFPEKNYGASNLRFMVRSVDSRFNISDPSEIASLQVTLPQVAPVFTGCKYHQDRHSIELRWTGDARNDEASFNLQRTKMDINVDPEWINISAVNLSTDSVYFDTGIESGKMYRYRISGAQGVLSPEITVKIPVLSKMENAENLRLTANRTDRSIYLEWRLDRELLSEIWLYRKKGGGKFSLYKTLLKDSKDYTDLEVYPNNTYAYLLIGVYTNGERRTGGKGEIIF